MTCGQDYGRPTAAGGRARGVATYSTATQTYTIAPGVQTGVYQQLSTRNGSEVISADQF